MRVGASRVSTGAPRRAPTPRPRAGRITTTALSLIPSRVHGAVALMTTTTTTTTTTTSCHAASPHPHIHTHNHLVPGRAPEAGAARVGSNMGKHEARRNTRHDQVPARAGLPTWAEYEQEQVRAGSGVRAGVGTSASRWGGRGQVHMRAGTNEHEPMGGGEWGPECTTLSHGGGETHVPPPHIFFLNVYYIF